jgi:hypothetical protein
MNHFSQFVRKQLTCGRKCRSSQMALVAHLTIVMSLAVSEVAVADDAHLEVHEWSLWVSEPSQAQLNALGAFPTSMPGLVETARSRRADPQRPNVSPLSIITFRGKPMDAVDISLRMTNGRFVAHWPPAEIKNNRLAWNETKLVAAPADAAFGFVPDDHWFLQARKLSSLAVQRSSRAERFIAYDPELNVNLPVRLEGGPDRYQVINGSKYPLKDVLIVANGTGGRRIGWLDDLPASKNPSTADAKTSTAANSNANPDARPAAAVVANAVGLRQRVVVAAPAPASAPSTPPAAASTPAAEKPSGEKTAEKSSDTSADITMGAAESDEAAAADVAKELHKRLTAAGLADEEIDLLLSLYGKAIACSGETVLLYRLPQSTIEEWMPLEIDPDTAKASRAALVLCFKVDPLIRDEVKNLIAQLADPSYPKREQAEKRLNDLGRMAIPAIKEAAKGADPERVMRAERLLLRQNERLEGK